MRSGSTHHIIPSRASQHSSDDMVRNNAKTGPSLRDGHPSSLKCFPSRRGSERGSFPLNYLCFYSFFFSLLLCLLSSGVICCCNSFHHLIKRSVLTKKVAHIYTSRRLALRKRRQKNNRGTCCYPVTVPAPVGLWFWAPPACTPTPIPHKQVLWGRRKQSPTQLRPKAMTGLPPVAR